MPSSTCPPSPLTVARAPATVAGWGAINEREPWRFPSIYRIGRLVVFPPYWMFQHEGRPPVSGDKYILSTYLLF